MTTTTRPPTNTLTYDAREPFQWQRKEYTVNSKGNIKSASGMTLDLVEYARMNLLPTPITSDGKGGTSPHNNHYVKGSLCKLMHTFRPDPLLKTSLLNPLYVEEMMGYPLEWLVAPFTEAPDGNG